MRSFCNKPRVKFKAYLKKNHKKCSVQGNIHWDSQHIYTTMVCIKKIVSSMISSCFRIRVQCNSTSIQYNNRILFRRQGNMCPPDHPIHFQQRLLVYSKFKFCNHLTPKIDHISKWNSYCTWEAFKVGEVANFWLLFGLRVRYNFTFTETRWVFFLLKLKTIDPKC